jgi:ribosomal protein S27E
MYEGRILRLFETGNREEDRVLKELVKLRLTVYTRHPQTGSQIHYDLFGGHFGFNLDAIAQGFEEAPKTWHVVEVKTSNSKNFNNMKHNGVCKTKWQHYCQMQMYMGGAKLTRAYYICVCKDTDEIYGERVYFDKEVFERLVGKAERVIFNPSPCYRITDKPEDFRCKWCDHFTICHYKQLPEINCRTCAHSSPKEEGGWECIHKENISSSDQRHPCDRHVFLPQLVPLEQLDADAVAGTISYDQHIINGPGAIASVDLQEVLDRLQSGEIEV